MTTIVKHRKTGNQYILIGLNGEGRKEASPSRFLSDLFTQEESEIACSVTICDVQGNMFLAYIDDLIVMEINGKKPSEILPEKAVVSTPSQVQSNDLDEDNEISSSYRKNPGNRDNFDDFEDDEEEDWI